MFVFVIDDAESELAVLDLIQVFVEVLDRSFENVCELDLIFNPDKVSETIFDLFLLAKLYCWWNCDGRNGNRDKYKWDSWGFKGDEWS